MTLTIYAEDAPVALVESEGEGPTISYVEGWRTDSTSFPISLSMPLTRPEPHGADVAIPWLMNLLPEGEPLRAMTQALGVSRDDVLGLIAETGLDLAGALTIGKRATAQPGYRAIEGSSALERIINELPAKPFLIGDDGVSMSLAGVQEKLPVVLAERAIAIPVNGAPSTHILKPDNPRLPGSVQNEALCMVLARRCGLSAASITTGLAGERSWLLVERYDREVQEGRVGRLHQEDFCQALGRPPVAKYEINGAGLRGPSLAEMFAVVRAHMTARDINQLLDAVIFNIAIGNVDSHAKNYSILLKPRRTELAPLYDLMSGLDWVNITQNHAQAVGGKRRGRHIYRRHWRRMAEACGLSRPGVLRRVNGLIARLLAALPGAEEEVASMPGGAGPMLRAFTASIGQRARLVQANALHEDVAESQLRAADEELRSEGDL